MLIASPTGDVVELRITRYQFDKSLSRPAGEWDDNWLVVAGRVTHDAESWSFHDPCLTSWEARALLSWMRGAAASGRSEIAFTEPNLAFAASPGANGVTVLVVTLRGEAAPPGMSDDDRWGVGRQIPFRLSPADFAAAAAEWERDLEHHPVR